MKTIWNKYITKIFKKYNYKRSNFSTIEHIPIDTVLKEGLKLRKFQPESKIFSQDLGSLNKNNMNCSLKKVHNSFDFQKLFLNLNLSLIIKFIKDFIIWDNYNCEGYLLIRIFYWFFWIVKAVIFPAVSCPQFFCCNLA